MVAAIFAATCSLASSAASGEWSHGALAGELARRRGARRAGSELTFSVWDALRDGAGGNRVQLAGVEGWPQRAFPRAPPLIASSDRSGEVQAKCVAALAAAPSDALWRRYKGTPAMLSAYTVADAYVSYEGLIFDHERFITDGSSRLVLDCLHAGGLVNVSLGANDGRRNASIRPIVAFPTTSMRLASVVAALRGDAHTLLYDEVATFGAHPHACADAVDVAVRAFDGTLAVGLRVFAINYYHFVAEFLPHLLLLADIVARGGAGRLLVYDRPHILEFLDVLGVASVNVELFDPCVVYRARSIVFVPAHEAPVPSAESVARVRQVVFASVRPAMSAPLLLSIRGHVVVITRSGAAHRAIKNAPQLLVSIRDALAGDDVRSFACERHSVRDQLAAFADAALVVGAEGACLANIMFIQRPRAAVVNIVPAAKYDFGPFPSSCGMTYAWHLAAALPNIEYTAFLLPEFTWADTLIVPSGAVAAFAASRLAALRAESEQAAEGVAVISVVVDDRAVAVRLCHGCDPARVAAAFCREQGVEGANAAVCAASVERRLRYAVILRATAEVRRLSVTLDGVTLFLAAPRARSARWAARAFAAAYGLDDATADALEAAVRDRLWTATVAEWDAAVAHLDSTAVRDIARFAAIARNLTGVQISALVQRSRMERPLFNVRRHSFLQRAVLCPPDRRDALDSETCGTVGDASLWPHCAALRACSAEAAFESSPASAVQHIAAAMTLDPGVAVYEGVARRFVDTLQRRADAHDCSDFASLKAALDALHAHLLSERRFGEAGIVAVRAWSGSCTTPSGDTLDIDDCGSTRAANALDAVDVAARRAAPRAGALSTRCPRHAAWTDGLRSFIARRGRACAAVDAAELSAGEFEERFLQAAQFGEPVVIRGGARDWALINASFGTLQRRFGGRAVKVSVAPNGEFDVVEPAALWRSGGDGDDADVLVRPAHMCSRLAAALDLVQSPIRSRAAARGGGGSEAKASATAAKFYIEYVDLLTLGARVANDLREPKWLRQLDLEDIKLWLGGGCAAARAKIHFDPVENLMVQLSGRKTFVLFHPRDAGALHFNPLGLREASLRFSFDEGFVRPKPSRDMARVTVNFAPVNISAPDFDRFPRLAEATPVACTIDAGDVLYVPSFWWHEVISEAAPGTPNLAVNFWYTSRRARLASGSLNLKIE